MKFNVNQRVRVKLTEYGRNQLRKRHEVFWAKHNQPHRPYHPPREDADGWSEWSMHALMNELGHLVSMCSPLPFETEIQLEPFE